MSLLSTNKGLYREGDPLEQGNPFHFVLGSLFHMQGRISLGARVPLLGRDKFHLHTVSPSEMKE